MRLPSRVPLPVISLACFAGLWQLLGAMDVSPALPRFDRVVTAMWDVLGEDRFQEALRNTASVVATTFVPMIVAGVLVGVAMGTFRYVDWIVTPYLNLLLSVPLVALIPVIVTIFGLERSAIVAVIVVYSVPAVIVNTVAGVRSVDRDHLAMARSFGASRALTVRRIVLPSASKLVMSGVKVAAGRAIKGAVIAEQVIGLVGLGGLIQQLGGAFAVEELYAVVLALGLIGIAVVWLLGKLERGAEFR